MRAEYHLLTSFLVAIIFILIAGHYQIVNLKSVEPLCLTSLIILSGVFIDLDHWFDFWYARPRQLFSLRDFLAPKVYVQTNQKVFVLWHSWEIIIGLFILLWFLGWPLWPLALWLGFFSHLLFDQIFNRTIKLPAYFWCYRFPKKFKVLR